MCKKIIIVKKIRKTNEENGLPGPAILEKTPKNEHIRKLGPGYRISSDTSENGKWNPMDYHYGP